jgi:DNA polymerase-3 subunit epsilon
LDAQLLAECYVELLGGRQQGLALAMDTKVAIGMVTETIVQRTPRLHRPSESELAAHAAMVAQLKAPLWVEAAPAPAAFA